MSDLIIQTVSHNIQFCIVSTKAIIDSSSIIRGGCVPVKLDDRVRLG